MCTVTFVRTKKNGFILTSNRDEAPDRLTHPPELYTIENRHLLFPKDSRAGGTWIGISDRKRLVCVLNGAFKKHKRKPPYSTSRGQIAKDLLLSENVLHAIDSLKLSGVEPFTMIIVEWKDDIEVLELVWDSERKHLTDITDDERIWSSSSLYDPMMKQERRSWFKEFQDSNLINRASLWKFHHEAGKGNSEYGVIMDRGMVKTTSVTQIIKSGPEVVMTYDDLQLKQQTEKLFKIPELNNG